MEVRRPTLTTSRTTRTGSNTSSASLRAYLRARYYDPAAGSFISRDSYGGSASQPLSQNRFAYAEANPVNKTDPSGHCTSAAAIAAMKKSRPKFSQGLIGEIWQRAWDYWESTPVCGNSTNAATPTPPPTPPPTGTPTPSETRKEPKAVPLPLHPDQIEDACADEFASCLKWGHDRRIWDIGQSKCLQLYNECRSNGGFFDWDQVYQKYLRDPYGPGHRSVAEAIISAIKVPFTGDAGLASSPCGPP